MKKLVLLISGLTFVALAPGFSADAPIHFEEKSVTWNQLPSSVRYSLERENARDRIREIVMEENNRVINYHVEVLENGKIQNYPVSVSGVTSKPTAAAQPVSSTGENLLTWGELPPAVQNTLQDKADRNNVVKVIKKEVTDTAQTPAPASKVAYVAGGRKHRESKVIQILEDGTVISFSDFVASAPGDAPPPPPPGAGGEPAGPGGPAGMGSSEKLVTWNQLPPMIRMTLGKQNGQDNVRKIAKEGKKNETLYRAQIIAKGQLQELLLTIKGKPSTAEPAKPPAPLPSDNILTWAQVPYEAKKTATPKINRSDIVKITKTVSGPNLNTTDPKLTGVLIEFYLKGQPKELRIGSDGTFQSLQDRPETEQEKKDRELQEEMDRQEAEEAAKAAEEAEAAATTEGN